MHLSPGQRHLLKKRPVLYLLNTLWGQRCVANYESQSFLGSGIKWNGSRPALSPVFLGELLCTVGKCAHCKNRVNFHRLEHSGQAEVRSLPRTPPTSLSLTAHPQAPVTASLSSNSLHEFRLVLYSMFPFVRAAPPPCEIGKSWHTLHVCYTGKPFGHHIQRVSHCGLCLKQKRELC